MTKAPISLQDLRRSLYVKAKAEPAWRFWGLYVHVCKMETLREAYQMAKQNDGAPGSDGVTFEAIEENGVESFLTQLRDELVSHTYQPMRARKKEIPKDGVISPLLSNLYLTEVDRMLERAIDTTRYGKYTAVQYARFADDAVILIDFHPRHDWLVKAVDRRLREELAKLSVEINEEKSRIVDLRKGESFAFLGFEFRRVMSCQGVWRPRSTPRLKKRTTLVDKLKEIFRRYASQPVERVIERINPILRGWVNYFAVGHSSRYFTFIKDWAEKKIRRHLMRARKRKGFGWKRWSKQWLYTELGLFNNYRVRRPGPWPKVVPAR